MGWVKVPCSPRPWCSPDAGPWRGCGSSSPWPPPSSPWDRSFSDRRRCCATSGCLERAGPSTGARRDRPGSALVVRRPGRGDPDRTRTRRHPRPESASAFAWKRRTLRVAGSLGPRRRAGRTDSRVHDLRRSLHRDRDDAAPMDGTRRPEAAESERAPRRCVRISGWLPMLWQAVDGMHSHGRYRPHPPAEVPWRRCNSARGILSALSTGLNELPGTEGPLATVRQALRTWQVDRVVIEGPSRDPVYASGFLTAVLGTPPKFVQGAWVWKVSSPTHMAPMIAGANLGGACHSASAGSSATHHPLAMAQCVSQPPGNLIGPTSRSSRRSSLRVTNRRPSPAWSRACGGGTGTRPSRASPDRGRRRPSPG